MVCNNCGASVPTGASRCPVCGNPVNANPNGYQQSASPNAGPIFQKNTNPGQQQNPNPGYQNNPYNPQTGFGNGAVPPQFNPNVVPRNAPDFVLYLIVSLVYTLCCCNPVFGILGIIFTVIMNSAFKDGNLQGYATYKSVAKWVLIIGLLIYIIGIVLCIFTGLFSEVFYELMY